MASDSDDGPVYRRPYDARRDPRRGVRIRPLPRHQHREFRRLCADVTMYIQSQLSTWRLAARGGADGPIVQAQLVYWSSALRWMQHLEYLATHHDPF